MIKANGLTFAYGGNAPAVNSLTFTVGEGEIFGFLGPSGAGKSTAQKILFRMLRGYGGDLHVMGRELQNWGPEYFERVGVCFELPANYRKLTALENLRFFSSFFTAPTIAPEEVLEWVGLRADANKRVEQFSKGMQTRLNLARSLINKPSLLFLDEPTSGLDPGNARKVRDLILRQREQGATVFLTTHDMHVADELCDRVGFLVNGRLARVGAPSALRLEHSNRIVEVRTGIGGVVDAERFPLDGLSGNQRFQHLLAEDRIQSIHSLEPSLEDVFMQVTGEKLA
ncbi:ABC transporter ATP-binding protein [Allopontixanthobacter sp.]|uniref:ABC transporter ATP-binding protein n=1 Tax=Allopontixanthobacter sp. TaxID=2906452 RepID=UPI002ABA7919|nr:ABC transporter ATP-binding protein [Allopontixanthobacter sp.]MDZ4308082.1 ABC transporter ATP-binding protein [Allopontixanthobacter sp.]